MVIADLETIQEELGRRVFVRFLDFVKIEEPPIVGRVQEGSVVAFEKWPHLIEIAESFSQHHLIVILKARQVGVSWLLAAFTLWTALYRAGSVIFLYSKGGYEAQVLLGKVKTIYRHLPEGMKVGIKGTPSLDEVQFTNGSKVRAFASTQNAGRSEAASLVIQDEADYHEWLDENFTASRPTIDAGGMMVMVSTSNKVHALSLFKAVYRGAPGNRWWRYFVGWKARPGRDDGWYEKTKDSVPTTERLSPEHYMEQEYPTTEDEALAPARVVSAFAVDKLKAMEKDIREAMVGVPGAPPMSHIYQPYSIGSWYVAFSDTSHGTGKDSAVTAIMDIQTGYVVADIFSAVLSPQELAFQSIDLLKLYRNPLWGIEENDWGILTIETATRLGYLNLFRDDTRKDAIGLRTHETKTLSGNRFLIWGGLIQAVEERRIVVPSREGLSQFYTVMRNPEKNGRIEAMGGAHDDYPFAVGGCWYLRQFVHRQSMTEAARYPARW